MVMKQSIFLCIFAFLFQGALSQQIGIKRCYVFSISDTIKPTSPEDFRAFLAFYSNGDYSLDLFASLTDDLPLEINLSYGCYNQENRIIKLTDDCYGYKMYFHLTDEDCLIASRSFPFLNNKKSYHGELPTSTPLTSWQKAQQPSAQKILKECYSHNQKYKKKYKKKFKNMPLPIGRYAGISTGTPLYLHLQSENTFSYYIEDMLVLCGEWSRNGNILQLKDSVLQQTFYAPIYKNGVSGIYLPGGWNSFFKYKSTEK